MHTLLASRSNDCGRVDARRRDATRSVQTGRFHFVCLYCYMITKKMLMNNHESFRTV